MNLYRIRYFKEDFITLYQSNKNWIWLKKIKNFIKCKKPLGKLKTNKNMLFNKNNFKNKFIWDKYLSINYKEEKIMLKNGIKFVKKNIEKIKKLHWIELN